jgi:hypothetical protein
MVPSKILKLQPVEIFGRAIARCSWLPVRQNWVGFVVLTVLLAEPEHEG